MDHRRLRHAFDGMQSIDIDGQMLFKPSVAYKNEGFLNSGVARALRVHTEVLEPLDRFDAAGVDKTILFFGSARSLPKDRHDAEVAKAKAAAADADASEGERARAAAQLERLQKMEWMCKVYRDVEQLARRLTEWSLSRIGATGTHGAPYIVATGGGPGLMEAANKGASSVHGAVTAGVAIELPFENAMNAYVTPELAFQCNYFFTCVPPDARSPPPPPPIHFIPPPPPHTHTNAPSHRRKFQLMHPCRALIVTAGGFGTCDELFEFLTLMQCGKTEDADCLPVVMFPGSYWKRIINWEVFVETGVIAPKVSLCAHPRPRPHLFFTKNVFRKEVTPKRSPPGPQQDMDLLYFTDEVEDAFAHVTKRLKEWEARDAEKRAKKAAEVLRRSPAAVAYDELLRASKARALAQADAAFAAAEYVGSPPPEYKGSSLPGSAAQGGGGGGGGGGAGAV
jgi:predicted Rossmann-fold nucleotide-binding protein